jgi:hypothetical protein
VTSEELRTVSDDPQVPVAGLAKIDDNGNGGSPTPAITLGAIPAIHAAQPGVAVTFEGSVEGRGEVTVRVNDRIWPGTRRVEDEAWDATVRIYQAGTIRVTARLDAEGTPGRPAVRARSPERTATVTLDSAVPDLTVVEPADGTEVAAGESGGAVRVVARTAPASQFGPRSLYRRVDGGAAVAVGEDSPGSGAFSAPVTLDPLPLGPRTLTIECVDGGGNIASRTIGLTVRDAGVPHLGISSPQPFQTFVRRGGSVTVPLRGSAWDLQSGMVGGAAAVDWSADGGTTWTRAADGGGWASWSADPVLTELGDFTFLVRATDRDGNRAQDSRAIQAVSDYVPASLAERLDERAYLEALLGLARDETVTAGGGAISTADLGRVFLQPFGELSQPASAAGSAGSEAVNRLQVVIESLRRAPRQNLLAGHWSFDAATRTSGGWQAADLSSGGRPARLEGGGQLVPGVGGGQALSLDGATRFAVVDGAPFDLGAGGADFTVAFHLRLDAGPIGQPRVVAHHGATDRERTFAIYLGPDSNALSARISTDVLPDDGIATSATELALNRWTHVAYVKRGPELLLYVDGRLDTRTTLSGATVANAGPLHIGKDPFYPGVVGALDDFRVYRLALSQGTIAALAAGPAAATLSEERDAGLGAYRQTAYDAMLRGLGTSFEDLRLARGAEPAAREAVAAQLGIRLTAGLVPDELELLTLQGDALTDVELERLFGLRDTDAARDPLRPAAVASVLRWREASLALDWAEEDHAERPDRGYPAILDPDLVTDDDLTAAGAVGAAGTLLAARRAEVATAAKGIRAQRTAARDQPAALAAVFTALPALDRAAFETDVRAGRDVSARLRGAQLQERAVVAVARAARLARTGLLTEPEWQVLEDIAVQGVKSGRYGPWREEERVLSLSPETFRAGGDPALRRWRATPAARAAWTAALQARAESLRAVREAHAQTLAVVEEVALPLLRDALVAAEAGRAATADGAQWLGRRLGTAVDGSAAGRTTRVRHAAETLQSVLFALRVGDLGAPHPAAGWRFADADRFDRQWRWLGTYEGWQAALIAWFYPEQALTPSLRLQPGRSATAGLRADATPQFATLIGALRARPRLSGDQAENLAAAYLAPLLGRLQAGIPAPLARWALDEGTGVNVGDGGSSGSPGTVKGAGWGPGAFGAGLTFAGTPATAVEVAMSAALGSLVDTFTISLWARPDATHIVDAESTTGVTQLSGHRFAHAPLQGGVTWGPGDAGVGVSVGTNGVGVYEHSNGYFPAVLVHPAPLSGWIHVAVVYEGRRPRLYVNGVRVRARAAPSAYTVHAGTTGLGGMAYGWFRGGLDDVRIFSSALSDEQIDALAMRIDGRYTDAELDRLAALSARSLQPFASASPPYLSADAGWLTEVFLHVPLQIALQLQQAGEYLAALDWSRTVYAYDLPPNRRKVYGGLALERNDPVDLAPRADWAVDLNPHTVALRRPNPATRFVITSVAQCLLDFGDAEFARATGDSIARARGLYDLAREVLARPELDLPRRADGAAEVPFPSPVLEVLRLRALVQPAKIAQGRNIAGLRRPDPATPRTGAEAVASVATDGRPPAPPAALQPTPYRFRVLVERARQLVTMAQQVEGTYLHALEQFGEAQYRRFEANKGVELATAGVELQRRRRLEADDAVLVATAQRRRSETLAERYGQRITAPLNSYEQALLDDIWQVKTLRDIVGGIDAAIGVAQAANQAGGFVELVTSFGTKQVASGVAAAGFIAKGIATGFLNAAEARMRSDELLAGHARQVEEWQLQQEMAQKDALIGRAQETVANDHVQVVAQEQEIATIQSRHAEATVEFLDRQFTNVELYEWMSAELAAIYGALLQQAAATARLAQDQLAFERQEPVPAIVQADYWEPPTSSAPAGGGADRRGLLGAERLLDDLTRLDQHAFERDRRRLNITQSFSVAQRLPAQFQEFRESGRIQFATPLAWLDECFPGHYLRLIRRVRVSLSALIPPAQGIRAMLSASGLSRVVVGHEGGFRGVVVRRAPETVALSSPVAATGVFELDEQADMLLPFEGMGFDTLWSLELPKAANPFDFRSIADLVLTFEYTALQDEGYRSDVVSRLNANLRRTGDRPFSLRRDFLGEWFELHNPVSTGGEDAASGRTATLRLAAADFPTHLRGLEVADVAVYLVPAEDADRAEVAVTLGHAGARGTATTVDGVASTRSGGAKPWQDLRRSDPLGDWTVTLDQAGAALLDGERMQDVLLVVGYAGQSPPWPL